MTPESKANNLRWPSLTSFGEYSPLSTPPSPSELLSESIADFDQLIEAYKNGEISDLLMFGRAHQALGIRLVLCPALREVIEDGIKEREKAILPALALFGLTKAGVKSRYALTRDWALNVPPEFRGKEGDYISEKLSILRDFFTSL